MPPHVAMSKGKYDCEKSSDLCKSWKVAMRLKAERESLFGTVLYGIMANDD